MAPGWGFRRSTALHSSAVVGSSAASQPGEGAAFLVYIPVVEGEVVEMAVQTNGEVPSGGETILLFDDEEHIRTSMKRLLELSGYDVLLGCDGLQALDIYKKHQGKIGVVILDISMPKMSGREALAELQQLDLAVKVLVFSGYAPDAEDFYEQAMGVVDKPPNPEDLLKKVRECLDAKPF